MTHSRKSLYLVNRAPKRRSQQKEERPNGKHKHILERLSSTRRRAQESSPSPPASAREKGQRRPADGEWCARDVLCHLSGDGQRSFEDDVQRFLDEDKTRALDITPGRLVPGATSARRCRSRSWRSRRRPAVPRHRHIRGRPDPPNSSKGRRASHSSKELTAVDEIRSSARWVGMIVKYHLNAACRTAPRTLQVTFAPRA